MLGPFFFAVEPLRQVAFGIAAGQASMSSAMRAAVPAAPQRPACVVRTVPTRRLTNCGRGATCGGEMYSVRDADERFMERVQHAPVVAFGTA